MKRIIIYLFVAIAVVANVSAQEDSTVVDSLQAEKNSVQGTITNVAITKELADSAYIKGDYALAIDMYENLLANKGESAEIYYNLGNSYYKNNNIAKSLLNLERALLLNPGDSDIRFNLDLVRSKTVDKVIPSSEVFYVAWFNSLMNCMGADQWAMVAIICFIIVILSLTVYFFNKRVLFKKISFVTAIIAFLLVVLTNIFAYSQKHLLENRNSAIIMVPNVTVKSTPNEGGTDLFILHEGHKVNIRDASMKEWVEIGLEDGNVGWIPVSAMEVI